MNKIYGKTYLQANAFLSDAQLRIYTVISSFQGDQESCFPSLSAIRERLAYYKLVNGVPVRLYRYSTGYISKVIKALRDEGWIILIRKGGFGRANEYRVIECPENLLFKTETKPKDSFPPREAKSSFPIFGVKANSSFPSMEAKHGFPVGVQTKRTLKEHIKEHSKASPISKEEEIEMCWRNFELRYCQEESLVNG
ncbi:MAG: hypothetical protein HS129_04820 [Leptospiraceae bacterium]|nr:hypothetical protein [Leptospiraceae bacterium]